MAPLVIFVLSLPLGAEERPPVVSILDITELLIYDWDGDGHGDRAALVDDEDGEIDLYLVLASGEWEKMVDLVWSGSDVKPTLSINAAGSLVVHTANMGIGRHRWESKLTIAYRDGAFVIAGFDHSYHDTLNEYPEVEFTANYLTGRSIKNKKVTKGKPRRIRVADWEQPNFEE